MSHYLKPVSEAEAARNANPSDQLGSDLASVDAIAHHSDEEQLRVRVSSEGDAGPATSTILGFDDDVAAERNSTVTMNLGHGLEVGDMVWAKVKSHPWWPGHIYNEAFASHSVRRNKREGHVLVAFFGDSSYGWFEPAELIDFNANFDEKSRQVSSRTFLKAVEEAVDEVSRRCAIGLACRCRNSDVFRATNVEGYFSVHLPDYEPGIYSSGQINRARNVLGPSEMLAFVKQLALDHGGRDHRSISFFKNRATVLAHRRAVFEQHDETYAQAFGAPPLRLSDSQASPLNRPMKQPTRAPLSGPLVIAETLGGEKNSTKLVEVKNNFEENKYLFKQQDESSIAIQLVSREETADGAGPYVSQEKPLAVVSEPPKTPKKHEDAGFMRQDGEASAVKAKVAVQDLVQPDGSGLAPQEIASDAKPCLLDKGIESSEEMTRSFEPFDNASKSMDRPDFSRKMALPSIVDQTLQSTSNMDRKTSIDKHDGNVMLSRPNEDFQQTGQGSLGVADEVKHHKFSVDGVQKKIKVHKRPRDDLNSESSAIVGKKKKKKRESLNLQSTSGHLEKPYSENSSNLSAKLTGKPVSVGLAPTEDSHAEPVRMDASVSCLPPIDSLVEGNFELPQLLGDLQALALDPFHGVERGIPPVARQFFLQFRSLVYQKSLFVSPTTVTENEAVEVHATKPPSSIGASDSPGIHSRASSLIKPVKRIVQPDDPARAGRKRPLSDRQEEIAAKRLKKIKDVKALAAEKKAAKQKTAEARQGEGKVSMVQAPPKIVKPDSTRKVERPAKPVEPTTLVIKFPPQTSLPSVAELKARFARFGPIDQSGLRVFWKSSTCRVVFLHKVDAQAAYKHAEANQSLFGNVGVRYFLRESGDSSSEVSEAAKARGDDGANEMSRIKDPPAVVQHQASVPAQQPFPQPMIHPKSILKKSTGDELGQGTGKGTPRVKFMLGGEESSRGEQLMVGSKNKFDNASFVDGGASSLVSIDFNSKNIEKVISQPSLPNIPLPTQFTNIPQHNFHNSEMAPRYTPSFTNASASATTTTVDISQQMITLLTRCSDVVTNLTDLLGYVPYHAL